MPFKAAHKRVLQKSIIYGGRWMIYQVSRTKFEVGPYVKTTGQHRFAVFVTI